MDLGEARSNLPENVCDKEGVLCDKEPAFYVSNEWHVLSIIFLSNIIHSASAINYH